MLKERLNKLGVLGCVMCIVGSVVIVLHAPQERTISSVTEVWNLATQPAFLLYAASVIAIVLVLIFHFAPTWGHTHVMVFVGICSLMGSLSVWFLFPLYYDSLHEIQKNQNTDLGNNEGDECQGIRDCYQTNIWRGESVHILGDMAFCDGGCHMYSYSNELFEQGNKVLCQCSLALGLSWEMLRYSLFGA